jgi:hypothetical protein
MLNTLLEIRIRRLIVKSMLLFIAFHSQSNELCAFDESLDIHSMSDELNIAHTGVSEVQGCITNKLRCRQ